MENLVGINFIESFSTFSGLAALNVFICQLIFNLTKLTIGWLKQVISWVLPILLCIIGYLTGIGMFSEYVLLPVWQGWVYTILVGLGIGLTSNGIYDVPLVKQLLETIKLLFDKIGKKQ